MAGKFVRSSKFRHVYGTPSKESFDNFNVTKSPWETNMCDVNEKFVAVVLEAGQSGAFNVCLVEKPYRIDPGHPKVAGHQGPVLDLAWNPFNDYQIASCSEDCTIKLWNIPEKGLSSNMEEGDQCQTLEGHQRKCVLISWHPTAENILASTSFDGVTLIWNVATGEPIFELPTLPDNPFSLCWNDNGSCLCVTSKDKKIRVYDPRQQAIISEGKSHEGTKPVKSVFCGKYIFTTGFSRTAERQYALWDPKDLSKPLTLTNFDSGASGCLLPFYDEGTRMVYLIGKGEGLIRYFEITDTAPYIFFLSNYQGKDPMRGAGCMPKRHLKHMECEVMRFYCLMTKKVVLPITMTVPRKSSLFQDDLYPPCFAGVAALTAEEWQSGQTKEPKKLVITKDSASKKIIDGEPSQSKLLTSSTPGSLSKQSSVSSNASEASTNLLKIERENSPMSLTASGEFDDSQYRKEIQSLKDQVQALKQENEGLKKQVEKKDSIISGIKKLIT